VSELDGSVVVVTGGGTGVGRALGHEAARRGATVVIASIADSTDAVESIRGEGGRAEWVDVDVSDYAAMRGLAERIEAEHGGIGVLVNNAVGPGGVGGVHEADPETVRRVFEVNILGVFNGIRAFADQLIATAAAGRPAHVLNVGSEHSLGVPPHVIPISPYTVTKYAALGLTDVARRDFAGTGVNVALLAPGWVLTEQIQGNVDRSQEFAAAVLPYAQTPDEVARTAFDGLLAHHYLIVTNPKSVPFAIEHAEAMLAELRRDAARDVEGR
jgi:NAD(P)-dependent dehydrogenase (short-subunit alcohol dehydrogenase family)